MFLREEREKNHAIVSQARKHWKQLHQTIKTSRGAIDARKRIKQKVNMMMSVRVIMNCFIDFYRKTK